MCETATCTYTYVYTVGTIVHHLCIICTVNSSLQQLHIVVPEVGMSDVIMGFTEIPEANSGSSC